MSRDGPARMSRREPIFRCRDGQELHRIWPSSGAFDAQRFARTEAGDGIAGSGIRGLRIGGAGRLAPVRDRAGRAPGGGARQFAAGLPDGRPQATHRHRPRNGRRDALLRLGSRGQRRAGCAGGPAGTGQRAGHSRTANPGRRQARPRTDLVPRSRRQPAGSVSWVSVYVAPKTIPRGE